MCRYPVLYHGIYTSRTCQAGAMLVDGKVSIIYQLLFPVKGLLSNVIPLQEGLATEGSFAHFVNPLGGMSRRGGAAELARGCSNAIPCQRSRGMAFDNEPWLWCWASRGASDQVTFKCSASSFFSSRTGYLLRRTPKGQPPFWVVLYLPHTPACFKRAKARPLCFAHFHIRVVTNGA